MPTKQRNSGSNSTRSINCRSERIEWNACNSIARSNFSDGIEAAPRIQRRELVRQRRQRLVHDAADRPQRMSLANPPLEIDVTEKRPRPLVPASHPSVSATAQDRQNHTAIPLPRDFFNGLLEVAVSESYAISTVCRKRTEEIFNTLVRLPQLLPTNGRSMFTSGK
jgi:hypothetical protein